LPLDILKKIVYNGIYRIMYERSNLILRNILIFSLLGILCIAVGIIGSCFLLDVFGVYLLFRAISLLLNKSGKGLRITSSVFFLLISVYLTYYSSLNLFSELDYALIRPQSWLFLPFAVAFVVLVTVMAVDRDKNKEEPTSLTEHIVGIHTEIMTVFAVAFIGYFGTFVLHFYFEYAACISVIVCLLNATADLCGLKNIKHTQLQKIKD